MPSTMPFLSQNGRTPLTSVLKWELDPLVSRKAVTILAGSGAVRAITLGMVLGQVLFGTPVITPDEGNTGDGALGSLTLGASCKAGTYKVTCIAEASNGGRFQVVDPDGYRLADALVGVAYAEPQLAFTITDGDADWDVDDVIEVEVPAGSLKYVQIDFSKTDGSQRAAAFAAKDVTAPDGTDAETVVIHRDALVADAALVWPAGATTNQKNAALAELALKRIETRERV